MGPTATASRVGPAPAAADAAATADAAAASASRFGRSAAAGGQQPPQQAWGQQFPQGQPGWGAPPPAWAPQGQPGLSAPPPKKGGGCGKTILILLVLLIVGVLAYGFIAKPSWFPVGAKASPTPGSALLSPKPSSSASPASSTTPAPLISVEPGGSSGASAGPTAATSAAPTASASGGAGDLATCSNAAAGITVSYPAAWKTVTEYPEWNCMLFDPKPIKIVLNSELPPVAIQIAQDNRAYAAVVSDFKTNTDLYELLDSQTGTVDGLDATAIDVRHTGNGLLAAGTDELVVVVNRGATPTLTLSVIGKPGATFDANAKILGTVIQNIKINQ